MSGIAVALKAELAARHDWMNIMDIRNNEFYSGADEETLFISHIMAYIPST